jgi:hypothetical protein
MWNPWSRQSQHLSMFQVQSLYDPQLWLHRHLLLWDQLITDTIALTDIIADLTTAATKSKVKPAEVIQNYSVTKRNGNLVIVNKEGYVVYHPPHFLKPYIKTREPLQKLAEKFTELNTNDVEAIMEFESSLR